MMTDNFSENQTDNLSDSEQIIVTESDSGLRLDKLIAKHCPDISRTGAAKLIENGHISINGRAASAKKSASVIGDVITVNIPEVKMTETIPQNIPIDIVYEDDSIIIVNKEKGMVVHPAPGNEDGTLVNALLFHCKLSGINGVIRPGIVHRIDKNTSGLLVAAKTDDAHKKLAAQIKKHSFTREYLAVCDGGFKANAPIENVMPDLTDNNVGFLHGIIEAPIGRNPQNRKKMCVIKDPRYSSREAKTEYTVVSSHDNHSFLRIKLYTGRTHQIRVHMSYIGRPVFGDDVYGRADKMIDGQCLHAAKLGFLHPKSGEYIEFNAPPPEYFERVLKKFDLNF
jgi:23S rRNA pseudouridine1911/1915/1917 synthase